MTVQAAQVFPFECKRRNDYRFIIVPKVELLCPDSGKILAARVFHSQM